MAAVKTTIAQLTDRAAVQRAIDAGMRKLRPDKAKHDSFFSLDRVWAQMRAARWVDLSLTSKRQRLMMALSIDTLARSSDIANLFVEMVELAPDPQPGSGITRGMFVSFAAPKSGGTFSPRLWIEAYPREEEICSCWMMRQWLHETEALRWPSVLLLIRGVTQSFTPVFFNLQKNSVGHALGSESAANIRKSFLASSGIDTSRFTGHSIRGAAVTAALLAGDGTDAWKENLRALGRWQGLATMMRHYCIPAGVLPQRRNRPEDYPSSVSAAVRLSL